MRNAADMSRVCQGMSLSIYCRIHAYWFFSWNPLLNTTAEPNLRCNNIAILFLYFFNYLWLKSIEQTRGRKNNQLLNLSDARIIRNIKEEFILQKDYDLTIGARVCKTERWSFFKKDRQEGKIIKKISLSYQGFKKISGNEEGVGPKY